MATEDKIESCLAKHAADLFQRLCSVEDRSLMGLESGSSKGKCAQLTRNRNVGEI